jgi:putative hemolysin
MLNFFQQNIFFVLSMGLLLMLSAIFSGTETALFSLTPENSRRLSSHRRIDHLIAVLRKDPSDLLACILFGNLIVNILFFCTGAVAAGRWGAQHGEWLEAVGGVLILLLVILFGEIVPKAAGITHPGAVLRVTAPFLSVWFRVSRPFRFVIRSTLKLLRLGLDHAPSEACLTPAELKELLDAVRHEPGFGVREKAVLEDIINLSDIRVREIMVPRVKLLRKSLLALREDILQEAVAGEYSHVLVYHEKDDETAGYIRTRDLFFSERTRTLDSLVRPLVFVPETKRVDRLLCDMLDGNWPLAVVVDEYGGLAGLVTIEDLFAEVVGEFEETDDEGITKLDENTYRLRGQLALRAWKELLTGILPEQEIQTLAFDTLGGFVISLLGRMPVPGDTVFVRNLRLTVESMCHRQIETVLLHLNQPEETP